MINIFLVCFLACHAILAQPVVALRKACCFSDTGQSYFVSEATFDTTRTIFPFNFRIKEFDLDDILVSSPEISTEDLIGIKNDSISYYLSASKMRDSSVLYRSNSSKKEVVVKLPYLFDYLNSVRDFRAKGQILYLLHKEHPEFVFEIDLDNSRYQVKEQRFIRKYLKDSTIKGISSENGSVFAISYESDFDGAGIAIVDLSTMKLISILDTGSVSKNVAKIVNGKIFSISGRLINHGGNYREASVLKIYDLKTCKIIGSINLEIDGLPVDLDLYNYEDSVGALLTFARRNETIGSQLTIGNFITTIGYSATDVKLIIIKDQ